MKNKNLFSLFAIVTGLVLLGAGCSNAPTNTQSPAEIQPTVTVPPTSSIPQALPTSTEKKVLETVINRVNVVISNFSFQPKSLSIPVGSTVTWTNNDSAPHTISADDGSFDSGNMAPGSNFSHTFSTSGNVLYHCAFHSSMHGSVEIK